MRKTIQANDAPAAVGPYSHAVRASGHVWVSGQIGLDPATGRIVDGGVGPEARRALQNVRAILQAAGSGVERVVRTTVYLVDLGDFEVVNGIYEGVFAVEPPARMCVEVSGLPKGARVAIDAVALS